MSKSTTLRWRDDTDAKERCPISNRDCGVNNDCGFGMLTALGILPGWTGAEYPLGAGDLAHCDYRRFWADPARSECSFQVHVM